MIDYATKDRRQMISDMSAQIDRQIEAGVHWCLAPEHRPQARPGVDCDLYDRADAAWEKAREIGRRTTLKCTCTVTEDL